MQIDRLIDNQCKRRLKKGSQIVSVKYTVQ